eukprot:jgi/Galph1/3151/GphlegSOOS_G1797.1
MVVKLQVKLSSAGLTPLSEFRAEINLSVTDKDLDKEDLHVQHSIVKKVSPFRSPDTHNVASPSDRQDAQVAYLVCQLAGRWVSEHKWVVPNVYESESSESMSRWYSSDKDVSSSESPSCPPANLKVASDATELDKTLNNNVCSIWKAALDDALNFGSIGVEGYSGFIFKYPPQMVLANQSIASHASISIVLSCELPNNIPPSFRGNSMRFQYLLALVVADAGRPYQPQAIRIPLTVTTSTAASVWTPIYIPLSKKLEDTREESNLVRLHTFRVKTSLVPNVSMDNVQRLIALSSNGRITPYSKDEERVHKGTQKFAVAYPVSEQVIFGMQSQQNNSNLETLETQETMGLSTTFPDLLSLNRSSTDSTQYTYQISQDSHQVACLCLWSHSFQLGDSIVGFIDFSKRDIPCYHMTIELETEESIHPKACNLSEKNTIPFIFRRLYGQVVEYPPFKQNTQFIFSIPTDAPVSFETSAVSLKWSLRFSFVVSKKESEPNEHATYASLLSLPVEQTDFLFPKNTRILHWRLPLVIYGGDSLAYCPKHNSHTIYLNQSTGK